MDQWLRLHTSTAGGEGSILRQVTKILQAMYCAPPPKTKTKQNKNQPNTHN